MKGHVKDLAQSLPVIVRDETKALSVDTNPGFEQMAKRLERIDRDICRIKQGMDQIGTRSDRDNLLVVSGVDSIKKRLGTCEERLGITAD